MYWEGNQHVVESQGNNGPLKHRTEKSVLTMRIMAGINLKSIFLFNLASSSCLSLVVMCTRNSGGCRPLLIVGEVARSPVEFPASALVELLLPPFCVMCAKSSPLTDILVSLLRAGCFGNCFLHDTHLDFLVDVSGHRGSGSNKCRIRYGGTRCSGTVAGMRALPYFVTRPF